METLASYDDVPYLSAPVPLCHPDRLYTMGRLFGLSPAPVTAARVLELGCSDGGNLLPMAWNLPESRFVGLDLSRAQIDMGRQSAKALGCLNLRLEHAGIMDVDDSWGTFDYVVCRGVYSWVPAEVREKILDIFSKNLAEQGVGYVDYNTLPGWRVLQTVRDLMKFHAAGIEDPKEALGQAMAAADLLASFVQTESRDYTALIEKEIRRIQEIGRTPDGATYVYHEYLEDVNEPVYFHQFMAGAEKHGLQYLGDAIYAHMKTHGFSNKLAGVLTGIAHDAVLLEQYMDFLRNRRFRHTLLCRERQAVRRNIDPKDVPGFMMSCTAKVTSDLTDQALAGEPASTALTILMEKRPRAVPFGDLWEAVQKRRGLAPPEETAPALAGDLIGLFQSNAVQFHSWQAHFTLDPGPRPRLAAVAAHQLSRRQAWLSNQCHEPVALPAPLMELAALLDGSRVRADLADFVRQSAADGKIGIQAAPGREDAPAPELTPDGIDQILDRMLGHIAAKALLVE